MRHRHWQPPRAAENQFKQGRNMSSPPVPSIVIVDDCELMRTLLRTILRNSEYPVIGEAKNGVGALELAERLRPDIICMDVMMPEMGGIEAMHTIKTMHPEIVIVMVTSSPSVDNVRESIRGGASGFIIKPFNAGKVLDTVRQAWAAKSPAARRVSA
jgi:two-component system chemotaxis response regulator CheY